MSEPQQQATDTAFPSDKKAKDRSPNYPAIGLRKALECAQKLFESDKRQFVLVPRAAVIFGFSAKSSGALLSISAMKKYGLLSEEGTGDTRKVKLTDAAISLLNPSFPNRNELLRQAALKPGIHAEIWAKVSDGASDGTIRDFLVYEKRFIDQAADTLIEQFNDTMEFAKLRSLDKNGDVGAAGDDSKKDDEKPSPGESPHAGHQTQHPKNPPLHHNPKPNVLAAYKIPLGRNEAELTFTGEQLEPDDFDALTDYVAIFKKQFERKLSAQRTAQAVEREKREHLLEKYEEEAREEMRNDNI